MAGSYRLLALSQTVQSLGTGCTLWCIRWMWHTGYTRSSPPSLDMSVVNANFASLLINRFVQSLLPHGNSHTVLECCNAQDIGFFFLITGLRAGWTNVPGRVGVKRRPSPECVCAEGGFILYSLITTGVQPPPAPESNQLDSRPGEAA